MKNIKQIHFVASPIVPFKKAEDIHCACVCVFVCSHLNIVHVQRLCCMSLTYFVVILSDKYSKLYVIKYYI